MPDILRLVCVKLWVPVSPSVLWDQMAPVVNQTPIQHTCLLNLRTSSSCIESDTLFIRHILLWFCKYNWPTFGLLSRFCLKCTYSYIFPFQYNPRTLGNGENQFLYHFINIGPPNNENGNLTAIYILPTIHHLYKYSIHYIVCVNLKEICILKVLEP